MHFADIAGNVAMGNPMVQGLNMGNIHGMPLVSSRGHTPVSELGMSGSHDSHYNLENLTKLYQVAPPSPPTIMSDPGSMGAIASFGMNPPGIGSIASNAGTSQTVQRKSRCFMSWNSSFCKGYHTFIITASGSLT